MTIATQLFVNAVFKMYLAPVTVLYTIVLKILGLKRLKNNETSFFFQAQMKQIFFFKPISVVRHEHENDQKKIIWGLTPNDIALYRLISTCPI